MLNFGNKEFRNLQEQVLKNAQDIEVLKGRENLQIVIVEELPEVGNPNYIYLVPNNEEEETNVYDEYIWLADSEEYEKIGGVSIDLTHYVTLDTEQTITAIKNLSADIIPSTDRGAKLGLSAKRFSDINTSEVSNDFAGLKLSANGNLQIEFTGSSRSLTPLRANQDDVGSSSNPFRHLYLGGNINFGTNIYFKNSSDVSLFYIDSAGDTWIYGTLVPEGTSGTRDIGNSSHFWKDLYLTGNISDGSNTVSVANMSTKTTSTYQSGTFDSNGETAVLIYGEVSTGLFIFAYGNCQCMLQITETMAQNADVTPIRVAIPMIYNSVAVNGWLEISRSTYTYTFRITDGTNHVDSGYAWTLTKTNLL